MNKFGFLAAFMLTILVTPNLHAAYKAWITHKPIQANVAHRYALCCEIPPFDRPWDSYKGPETGIYPIIRLSKGSSVRSYLVATDDRRTITCDSDELRIGNCIPALEFNITRVGFPNGLQLNLRCSEDDGKRGDHNPTNAFISIELTGTASITNFDNGRPVDCHGPVKTSNSEKPNKRKRSRGKRGTTN